MKTIMQRLSLGLLLTGVSAAGALAASSLGSGQSLAPGASLDVGNSRLVMQGDCNLVLYRGGQAAWHSQTDGKGAGCRAVMQTDGNFVVYNGANQPLWNAGTNGNAGAILTLQTDGNLVMTRNRQPIWSNGTAQVAQNGGYGGQPGGQGGYNGQGQGQGGRGPGGFNGQGGPGGFNQGGLNQGGQGGFRGYGNQPNRRAQDDLFPGEWLDGRRNDKIASRNRQFELRMQADCNLVLYNRNQPLWESRTQGAGRDCRAIFSRDGQLQVEADGRVVWTNRARARSGQPDLRMQDDGNLVAYDGARAFWATNTENSRFGRGGFGGGYQYDQRRYDNNNGNRR